MTNLLIGINGNEANVHHRVGVGQYAYELINGFKEYDGDAASFQVYLESQPLPDMPQFEYKIFGPKKMWTLTGLQKKLVEEKITKTAPNVFFTPTHYTPLYMPIPSVISIMDLAFDKFPEYFKKKDYLQLKYWTQISVLNADKILTISEHTKKDICHLYAVSPEKVTVTYPGYDKERFSPKIKDEKLKIKSITQKYKIGRKYLVFLGTVQPRKNLVALLEAFATLARKDFQLVVVGMIKEGRGGWLYEPVFQKVKDLNLGNRVIFTGYVPDADVPYLFAGSEGYILPSLYEGFGIPPIEAMATGVPVVVSRVSSLPEVCGDAAIYIDKPRELGSIKDALEKLLTISETEHANRIDLGLSWVKRYNWKTTTKQTLAVLEEVATK